MSPPPATHSYKRHRFPAEIISHGVWPHCRFCLSYRDGKELQHRYLDNHAENSHQPTRQRERRMQGFKSPGGAQRFLAAYGPIVQHFRPRRHRYSAPAYCQEMRQRFDTWQDITSLPTAA